MHQLPKLVRSNKQILIKDVVSVGLVIYLFLNTIRVSTLKISSFYFNANRVWGLTVFLFAISLEYIYHARTFIPKQNHPSINME